MNILNTENTQASSDGEQVSFVDEYLPLAHRLAKIYSHKAVNAIHESKQWQLSTDDIAHELLLTYFALISKKKDSLYEIANFKSWLSRVFSFNSKYIVRSHCQKLKHESYGLEDDIVSEQEGHFRSNFLNPLDNAVAVERKKAFDEKIRIFKRDVYNLGLEFNVPKHTLFASKFYHIVSILKDREAMEGTSASLNKMAKIRFKEYMKSNNTLNSTPCSTRSDSYYGMGISKSVVKCIKDGHITKVAIFDQLKHLPFRRASLTSEINRQLSRYQITKPFKSSVPICEDLFNRGITNIDQVALVLRSEGHTLKRSSIRVYLTNFLQKGRII